MRRLITAITIVSTMSTGLLSADIITQGLDLAKHRSPAALTMSLAADQATGDLVTVRVGAEGLRDIKGFGFVMTFDPEQFAYVGSAEAGESLISRNGTPALMVHKNHQEGRVAVGAVQVDGSSASGDGALVEVTFRKIGDIGGVSTGFGLTEGIVVDLAGGATEVETTRLDELLMQPTDYRLDQNVPNPFNPETTISYQLPAAQRVLVSVYTSLGQEVRTLVDEVQDVGAYTVRWDGRDAVGRQVASGVYFYRMQAGDFSDVKRMMLLK